MNLQEQKIKIELTEHINKFFELPIIDGQIGYLPENVSECMAEAAMSVLLAVKGTNDYFEQEGMLKD